MPIKPQDDSQAQMLIAMIGDTANLWRMHKGTKIEGRIIVDYQQLMSKLMDMGFKDRLPTSSEIAPEYMNDTYLALHGQPKDLAKRQEYVKSTTSYSYRIQKWVRGHKEVVALLILIWVVFTTFLNELNKGTGIGIVNIVFYVSIATLLYNIYFLIYGAFDNMLEISKEYYYGYETRPALFWRGFRKYFYRFIYEPQLEKIGRRLILKTLAPVLIIIVACCWFKIIPVYTVYLEQPNLIFRTLAFGLMAIYSLGIVSANGKWE